MSDGSEPFQSREGRQRDKFDRRRDEPALGTRDGRIRVVPEQVRLRSIQRCSGISQRLLPLLPCGENRRVERRNVPALASEEGLFQKEFPLDEDAEISHFMKRLKTADTQLALHDTPGSRACS